MTKKRQQAGRGAPPAAGGDTPPPPSPPVESTTPAAKAKAKAKPNPSPGKARGKTAAAAPPAPPKAAPKAKKPKKPPSKHAAARAARRPKAFPKPVISTAPPERAYDAAIAKQLQALAGQGTVPETAATYMAMTTEELFRIYGEAWASGCAVGEIKVDQVIAERATGRDARFDDQGRLLSAEVKADPTLALFLRKRIEAQRRHDRVTSSMDWAKVHPAERPPGLQVQERRPGDRRVFRGKYTAAIADEIINRLVAGEYLVEIAAAPHLPDYRTILYWAAAPETYPKFASDFACAREAQIEALIANGSRVLLNPQVEAVVTVSTGPDGETVTVQKSLGVAHARAIAEYNLKAAAILNGGRIRSKVAMARLEAEYGQEEEAALEDDDAPVEGSWIVMKDGGSPDR